MLVFIVNVDVDDDDDDDDDDGVDDVDDDDDDGVDCRECEWLELEGIGADIEGNGMEGALINGLRE
jgi:hypothetical protein